MPTLVLFGILWVAASWFAVQGTQGIIDICRARARHAFLLSPLAIAACDVTGCDRPPRYNLGSDTYVCGSHL